MGFNVYEEFWSLSRMFVFEFFRLRLRELGYLYFRFIYWLRVVGVGIGGSGFFWLEEIFR